MFVQAIASLLPLQWVSLSWWSWIHAACTLHSTRDHLCPHLCSLKGNPFYSAREWFGLRKGNQVIPKPTPSLTYIWEAASGLLARRAGCLLNSVQDLLILNLNYILENKFWKCIICKLSSHGFLKSSLSVKANLSFNLLTFAKTYI